ncbi:MAG: hypothetical protein GC206_17005 [Alphaproteobacteria bacterium]|nr:hypothetical protein [Alphaproteobacteria bacterium]
MPVRSRFGLLALALTLLVSPASAREDRTIAIGGHEMTIALADGDCFFDADLPADKPLLDQLSTATGDQFVLLVAFGNCETIAGWRTGTPATISRFGYMMIAGTHLEPVFAFGQPVLNDAIAQALADRGVPDYKADIVKLAADLEAAWKVLPPGGRHELGILHRDRFGPTLATLLSVPGAGGQATPRVMLHQSVLVAGKVVSIVSARDYQDAETVFEAYGDLSAVVEATAARN